MKPTEELKKEHEAIKLMVRIMGSVSDRLESGKKVDPKHLDSILEFIKVFADKCHHAKEEDLLFPVMEKAGIPKEGGPVGMMLLEHDEGRQYVKAMGEGIKGSNSDLNFLYSAYHLVLLSACILIYNGSISLHCHLLFKKFYRFLQGFMSSRYVPNVLGRKEFLYSLDISL
jgi:DUF438 domain-containing protein